MDDGRWTMDDGPLLIALHVSRFTFRRSVARFRLSCILSMFMVRILLVSSLALVLVAASPRGYPALPNIRGISAWEPDVRASQDTTGSGQNETLVAANPLNADNAIVVYKDYRNDMHDYLSATTDGGVTWHEQIFPRPNPDLPQDTDPTVFFRPDGRAYLLWTSSSDFQHGGLFSAWSDDGGQTWSQPVVVSPPEGHFDDKPWLAFETTGGPFNGTIYASWTRFGNAEIMEARSTDGGSNWSAPVQVSVGPWSGANDGAQPLVLPDGTLVIIFLHANPANTETVMLARSTDGGATFPSNVPLFDIQPAPYTLPGEHWRLVTYESLAYDPVRGWLTLVWSDYGEGDTNGVDIYTSRSTDAGVSWSDRVRLNDDPPGIVRDQWFPTVAAAPDGRLTAMWLDRRDDPANRLYYDYARTSTDGGLSWAPSVRVSSAPSDPGVNIPPGSDGIGDYIGLSAGPDVVWGSWVDVRNGDQDIYAAREIFTPQPTPTRTATSTMTGTATATATATAMPTATSTSCPTQFSDVPPSSTFYPYVRCLACRGIVNGYTDGTFRPNNNVTRGQLCKIISNSAGFHEPQTVQLFQDVPPGSTFFVYIGRLASRGYMSGYPCGGPGEACVPPDNLPYFRPGNSATRGQIAKVDSNAAGYTDPPFGQTFQDVPPGSPFYTYTQRLASRGVMQGYPCGGLGEPCLPPGDRPYFRPFNNATRGQTSKITANTFFPACVP
jgi:hypothetical protein